MCRLGHDAEMSLVEQYWSGVLRRLQAEVDSFNQIIPHQGEKGRANELSLTRVIERLVPGRYGVGSGVVIDSDGTASKQMDIIIYDRVDEPQVMAQTTQFLFPVENVRACIEVKTTLNEREIQDVGEKRNSVARLRSTNGKSPLFSVVAFKGALHPATLAEHITALKTETQDGRPDFLCVLGIAMWGCSGELGKEMGFDDAANSDKYKLGVCQLHNLDETGQRILDSVRKPKDDASIKEIVAGLSYPVVPVPGHGDILAEPSRALLLFTETLLCALALRIERTRPAMSHYLVGPVRDVVALEKVGQPKV